MRIAVLAVATAVSLAAIDATALTLTNSNRELIVTLFGDEVDPNTGDPVPILLDGDEKFIVEGEVFTQNQSVLIGAAGNGVVPQFEARGAMTASGVFGFEAFIDPNTLPLDGNDNPIEHTVEARLKLRTLFLNQTNEVFKFDSSFFINGGELVAGFSDDSNEVSYSLNTFVGPAAIVPGSTSPEERSGARGEFQGLDFDPINNVFNEFGTSLNPARDDDDGRLIFPFQEHVISDREILPGEQIAVNYDLILRIVTSGGSEGPLSFFFNDPLGLNGLPIGQTPGVPDVTFTSLGPVSTIPVPPLAPVFAGVLIVVGGIARARRRRR